MDSAWIGIIGTAIGAASTGVVELAKVGTTAFTERSKHAAEEAENKARREHEAAQQKAQRDYDDTVAKREAAASMLATRRGVIARWREQLETARNNYVSYREHGSMAEHEYMADVVGDQWFEELRPHLVGDGLRDATRLLCSSQVVTKLSLEIGRIEAAWVAEAGG